MSGDSDRIRTTHVGSLPRPRGLLDLVQERPPGAADSIREAVAGVVRRQVDCGIDVVSDGEFGKPSFLHYVNERLGGFVSRPGTVSGSPWGQSREVADFPEYYAWAAEHTPSAAATATHMVCTGPVTYQGHEALRTDIENLKAALGDAAAEAFMPAISPSNVAEWQVNEHYDDDEAFLYAIADAMREEYAAIIESGLLLQIDDPSLVTYYVLNPQATVEECRRVAATRIEALNHALRDLPKDRIRFHTCYSINIGPRVHDMELKDIVDLLVTVRAGHYSFEAANPRHEHEWRVWQEADLPDDVVLMPGVITNSNVMVEHPEVIADRLLRYADVVGRDRVIASSDCGFASFAGTEEIQEKIVWAKLASLVEGAGLASARLR